MPPPRRCHTCAAVCRPTVPPRRWAICARSPRRSPAFAAINAVLAGYAIIAFIGVHTSLVDIWVNVMSWLYKPQRYRPAPSRPARQRQGPRRRADPSADGATVEQR